MTVGGGGLLELVAADSKSSRLATFPNAVGAHYMVVRQKLVAIDPATAVRTLSFFRVHLNLALRSDFCDYTPVGIVKGP